MASLMSAYVFNTDKGYNNERLTLDFRPKIPFAKQEIRPKSRVYKCIIDVLSV